MGDKLRIVGGIENNYAGFVGKFIKELENLCRVVTAGLDRVR